MRKNVTKYYFLQFFYAQSFAFVPIFVVYMYERGLSFSQVGICLSVYYLSFLIFELPTGVIADKLGRKISLSLSLIIKLVALAVFMIAYSLPEFLIGEVLFALGRSLGSGAGSAFLYDSLIHFQEEQNYKKFAGKAHGFHLIGNSTAGFAVAVILYFGHPIEYVIVYASLMAFIASVVALFFEEPLKLPDTSNVLVSTIRDYSAHLVGSVKEAFRNKTILWLFAYSSLIFLLLRSTLVSLQQPLFMFLEIPKYWFGLIDTFMALGAAIFPFFVQPIERKLGMTGTLLMMPIIMIISYLGITYFNNIFAIAFVALQTMIHGLYPPVVRDYLNQDIKDSYKRATILSIESLASRGIFSIYALFLGSALDLYSVQTAFGITTILAISVTIILFIPYLWLKR